MIGYDLTWAWSEKMGGLHPDCVFVCIFVRYRTVGNTSMICFRRLLAQPPFPAWLLANRLASGGCWKPQVYIYIYIYIEQTWKNQGHGETNPDETSKMWKLEVTARIITAFISTDNVAPVDYHGLSRYKLREKTIKNQKIHDNTWENWEKTWEKQTQERE